MLFADPRWLLAVVPEGLVCVGPEADVEVAFDAPVAQTCAVLEALCDGTDADRLAAASETDRDEAEDLLERLLGSGVLQARPPAPPPAGGRRLADAILRMQHDDEVTPACFTATELLVVAPGSSEAVARRALRGFVAGLAHDRRLAAYCHLARRRRPTVRGDVPDPAVLERALTRAARLDADAVAVLELGGPGCSAIAAGRLLELGAGEDHRLGPVLSSFRLDVEPPLAGNRVVCSARYAVPNLSYPQTRRTRLARGAGDGPEVARTLARGEAAERYAGGDIAGRKLFRATAAELEAPVAGDRLYRLNERQYEGRAVPKAFREDTPRLWTVGVATDGSARQVPAEAVFFPFVDPCPGAPSVPASSSGMAAHLTFEEARTRALCELVERDAFMWTWVQRISRERLRLDTLPERMRSTIAATRRMGLAVDLVNLTLETAPVILCAIHDDSRVCLGAACGPDPAQAAAKALDEAATIVSFGLAVGQEGLRAEAVRLPEDHLHLNQTAECVEQARFLFSGDETVDVREVTSPPDPIADLLAVIGEPVIVDLSSSSTAPYRVVRALVPGLVPISFGYDNEPLGMPRLSEPRQVRDGRTLGDRLDLARAGPIMPHPFP